jgi:LytS/YehU family sensor histidine kinase
LYTRADLSFANVRAVRLRAEEARALQLSIVYRQEPESILGAMRALRQLIYKDVQAAVCFAEELASVHRYILGESWRRFVMLREELEPLAAHQRLLQARFRTAFSLNITVPADAPERYLIVPASLHLLLENALLFEHFPATSPSPCVVDIAVHQCQIQLTYRWQPRPTTRSEALRLDGLAARIRTLIGLEMQVDRSGECVSVGIPLLPLLA